MTPEPRLRVVQGRELPSPRRPLAVAQRLIDDRYTGPGGTPLLRHWRGGFWAWQTSHWAELEEAAVRATIYEFTRDAFYNEPTKSGGPEQKSWAPNRYKVADVVDALRALGHLPERVATPSWTTGTGRPPAGEIVSCANGLLVVTTRDLLAHTPALFNEVAVPFDYDPNVPPPTRWLEFLSDLWPDDPASVAALQEFFGYVISGRTDLQKILLLIGPTRAGKGVIARILKTLVGAGNVAGPTLASLGTNFGLAPLIGRPLAIVSDARLGAANVNQIVERLLSISGEDMLTIDRKYRDPWTGTLPTRLVVISNELPHFRDASAAIANRFIILTLRHSFLGRENPALTRELLDEMPGILRWALEGLDRLTRRGTFTVPASSADAVVALADTASPVSAFVRDCCEICDGYEISTKELFDAWKQWAEDNGHRPGASSTFGSHLRAAAPGVRSVRPKPGDTDARPRFYRGIRLRPTIEVHLDPLGPDAGVQAGPSGPALFPEAGTDPYVSALGGES